MRKLAVAPVLPALILATSGWFYVLRLQGVPGPNVREALPLDELAKHSSVPLLEFAAVWLVAALLVALAVRWAGAERLTAALVLALSTWALLYAVNGVSIAITRQIPARDAFAVATRLESVYLPAAFVAVAVAILAPTGRRGRRSPLIVGTLVAAAGALDLLHTTLPGDSQGLLHDLTPDAVGPLARAACAFAGAALLLSSRGLARRRRRAWEVAVAVAALSTLLHVLRGLTPATLVAAAVLVLLIARRHDFELPGDHRTRFLIAGRAAVSTLAIATYGVAAVWLNRLAADRPFTLAFAGRETLSGLLGLNVLGSPHLAGDFGQWFPLSLLLLGLGATTWIVSGWVAPWRHRVRQEARDREHAQELVRRWGQDTLAPFALRRDKSYFFSDDGEAFLCYRVVGGVAIVSGDPIGPPDESGALVARFVAHAHERDWRVAILGASERFLGLYRTHGLQALYHGDEAVVDTATFSLEGRAIRKVRQSVHRLEKAGYVARLLRPGDLDDDLRAKLEAITTSWRGAQPERGFVMALDGLFALSGDDAVYAVGFDRGGEPRGFLHFAVAPAISALSLSSMPRLRSSTPNGFNEWLICETVDWARDHGLDRVSLNFSPFAALLSPEAELTTVQEVQRRALLKLKGRFQLDDLLAFNKKFFPSWERRFLVFERRLDLPRVGIAALAVESYLPFQGTLR